MIRRSAEVARGIWSRDAVEGGAPGDVTAEGTRICAQLQTGLVRWVGAAGYRALVDRALEQVRPEHPALAKISCNGNDNEEIAAAVQAHGAADVAAGIVALVATLIDLLSRIIGEDMSVELVTRAVATSRGRSTNAGTQEGQNG